MQIKAATIGHISFSSLSIDQEGLVLGNTSKGVFIRLPGELISFISPDQFRGPLTINVPGTHAALQQIPSRSPVEILSGTLRFPVTGIEIATREAIVWQPALPSELLQNQSERTNRLRASMHKKIANKDNVGITSLLPYIINDQSYDRSNFTAQSNLHKKIVLLADQMRNNHSLPSSNSLANLLGAGKGLTPSGDDFIIGLILAFNRWKKALKPGPGLQDLNQLVVNAAYKKTTLLSANLIDCAAQGYADERLINALDWLISESSQSPDPIDLLLDWGDSSGGDVFVGFAVALSVLDNAN